MEDYVNHFSNWYFMLMCEVSYFITENSSKQQQQQDTAASYPALIPSIMVYS